MGVVIGDVDALMAYTVCDSNGAEAHVNQQRHMRVPEVVNSDALHACLRRPPLHFPLKMAFADGEDAVIALQIINGFEIVLHLLTQEFGHLDDAVALFGFGRGDQIFAVDALVGLVDGHGLFGEVKVCGGEGEKLAPRMPHQYSISNA